MSFNFHHFKRSYNQDYFDNVFYREQSHSHRNLKRLKLIQQHKSSGTLLEIGCGQGFLLHELQPYFQVEGIEVSAYAAEYAKSHFDLNVSQLDVQSSKLKRNRYDCVVAFNILEHLADPQTVVQTIHQSLKKDGVFIGSVPNNFGLLGSTVTAITNIVDKTHCSTYPPAVWQTMFVDAGFTSVLFFGENPVGRNRAYYNNHTLWPHTSLNLMFVCRVST